MMELVQLQNSISRFEDLGVGIVAVTTENAEGIEKTRKRVKASFPIVRDHREDLMNLFGLRDETPSPAGGGDILRSANILVSPDGHVIWAHRTTNYRVRPSPDLVLDGITRALLDATDD
jgi:peroxiredoxin